MKFRTDEDKAAAKEIRDAAAKAKREIESEKAAKLLAIREKAQEALKKEIEAENKEYWDNLYAIRKEFYKIIAEAKAEGKIPKSTKLKKMAELPDDPKSITNVSLVMKRRFGTRNAPAGPKPKAKPKAKEEPKAAPKKDKPKAKSKKTTSKKATPKKTSVAKQVVENIGKK